MTHLQEEGTPDLVFSAPLVIGGLTLIRAATVSCTVGHGRLGTAALLRVTPCAVLVIKDGEVSIVPVKSAPGTAEKVADLVLRLRQTANRKEEEEKR